jgi:hypothetical protein
MSSSKYLAAQKGVLFVVVAQGFKRFPTFIDLVTRAHYRSVSELHVSSPHSYTVVFFFKSTSVLFSCLNLHHPRSCPCRFCSHTFVCGCLISPAFSVPHIILLYLIIQAVFGEQHNCFFPDPFQFIIHLSSHC